jgi:hypothetical protein
MPDVGGIDTSIYKNVQTPNMLESMGQMANTASAITGAQRQQVELAHQKIGMMSNAAKSILALPNPSQQDAVTAMQRLVSVGAITPQDFAKEAANIPQDPNGIKNWAAQHAMQLEQAGGALSARYGAPSVVNLGNRLQGVTINPVTNQINPMGGQAGQMVPGLSPEAATSPENVVAPNGQAYQTTRAQRTTMVGGGPDTTGMKPGALGAPSRSGNAPGGLPAPGPQFEAGKKAFDEDIAVSADKIRATQPLLQAIPLIEKLGSTGSGPTSQAFNDARSTLVTLGIIKPDDTKEAAYDKANKYLEQYSGRVPTAARSDASLYQAQTSNPNLKTSNAATLALAKQAVAYDRMDAARGIAFQDQANQGGFAGYQQHRAGWTQNQDARAYGLDLMDPGKRQKLLDDMKAKANTPEGKKFWNSLSVADKAGFLGGGQ